MYFLFFAFIIGYVKLFVVLIMGVSFIDCPITFVSPSLLPLSIQEIVPSSFPAYLLDNFCLAYAISQTVLSHFSLTINETVLL